MFDVSVLTFLVLCCQVLVSFAVKQALLWAEPDLWSISFRRQTSVGLSWSRGSASGQGGEGERGGRSTSQQHVRSIRRLAAWPKRIWDGGRPFVCRLPALTQSPGL